jgi:hypothetical protein
MKTDAELEAIAVQMQAWDHGPWEESAEKLLEISGDLTAEETRRFLAIWLKRRERRIAESN